MDALQDKFMEVHSNPGLLRKFQTINHLQIVIVKVFSI